MSLFYDLFFLFYAALYLPYLLISRRFFPGYAVRLGFFPAALAHQIKSRPNIWLHAVSVGEVMVIDTLLQEIRKRHLAYQIVVTVTTKTGHALAVMRLKDKAVVIPSPLDLSFIVKKFVDLIQPKIYISAETEIWPNLYRTLYKRQIPIIVVNGRISQASFGRYKMIRFLLKNILNQASMWCMQSQGDADRIITLGADPSRVVVYGNIKFDQDVILPDAPPDRSFLGGDELLWVAGSTHPGEEDMVLDVYECLIKENPKWRLVIAPRHVERARAVIELVKRRGFDGVKFSEGVYSDNKSVIVVDSIGRLRFLYSLASLVFVGKSLCVGGGHNIIEPAFYGKPIVIGPMVDNFKQIVASFRERDAIVQVDNRTAFLQAMMQLSVDSSKREALGRRAREVVLAHQGSTKKILERLGGFLYMP